MRIAIAEQFQYRVANYFYMIGMVAEPVIYLVVWSTVAFQHNLTTLPCSIVLEAPRELP